jgi:hypothetical protein
MERSGGSTSRERRQMEKGVHLTAQEAAWLGLHLFEIVEAIDEGRPLRYDWVRETDLFIRVLVTRLHSGGANPNNN